MKRIAATLTGFAILAGLWEALGRSGLLDTAVPALSAVVAFLIAPEGRGLLVDALTRTGGETLLGLAFGCAAALLCAGVGRLVPPAAPSLFALAGIVNGIPIIAIAGVCVLTLPRDATPVVVAALAAAFIVFVGATAGFDAGGVEQHEVFRALGSTRWITFLRLDLPSSVPIVLGAIRAAAPVAVVGAILGEWFAAEHGLGPMLIAAMQNYQTVALWGIALAGALLSMVLYGLLGLVRELADRALQ